LGNFDQYFPFDKGFGAPASAALWGKMAQQFAPDGVLYSYLNQLNATVSGGNVTIQTGAAMVHGYYGEIQNNQTFPVGTNGMVVAAVDMSAEVMSIYYKDTVTDYSGLTQSSTLWEIPLWLVSGGTTLIDKRAYTDPGRGMGSGVGASIGSYIDLAPGANTQFNTGFINFTHPSAALFIYQIQFQIAAASTQAVLWNGTYQNGQPDANLTYTYEWLWPGASGTLNPSIATQTISWIMGVTPGKKSVGFHVVVGTGGSHALVANMGVQVVQIGLLSVN
jgi:hypothetical protein